MRKKPKNADWYGWHDFEKLADREGYGEDSDDWSAWWECWKAAIDAKVEKMLTNEVQQDLRKWAADLAGKETQ